jgi:hypothetical protein
VNAEDHRLLYSLLTQLDITLWITCMQVVTSDLLCCCTGTDWRNRLSSVLLLVVLTCRGHGWGLTLAIIIWGGCCHSQTHLQDSSVSSKCFGMFCFIMLNKLTKIGNIFVVVNGWSYMMLCCRLVFLCFWFCY